jgi:ATP-dependent Clp protease ATP-binding subunit ClpC
VAELGYRIFLIKQKHLLLRKVLINNGARPKKEDSKVCWRYASEEIITSKITSGDEIFMDIEEGAQELTVQIHKAESLQIFKFT